MKKKWMGEKGGNGKRSDSIRSKKGIILTVELIKRKANEIKGNMIIRYKK